MNAAQPATVTAYTQTEIDRVKADGTVAVMHYETTLPGVLSLDPEDVADFLAAPVHPEEEAFLDSGAEPAIVEDTVSGRIYAVTRSEDGPASASDITAAVLHEEAARGELIGHVGVDSGCVMLGDPCYGDDEEPGALMEAVIDAAETAAEVCTPRGDLGGIVVSTAYGDGIYPVFAHRDSDGRIIRMTVEFD